MFPLNSNDPYVKSDGSRSTIKDALEGGGGSGGDTVTITPTIQSGAKIADFSINGVSGSLYAPVSVNRFSKTDVQSSGYDPIGSSGGV